MIKIRPVSDFLKEYKIGVTIGKSKISTIKEVIFLKTNETFAAKITEKNKVKNIYDEFNILVQIQDIDNVINLYNAFEDELYFLIILKRLKSPDMAEYISENGKMKLINVKKIIYVLSQVIKKLHSRNIIHIDIKPDNIMCGYDNKIYLFDFGLAKTIDNIKKCSSGTIYYVSPEIIINMKYSDVNIEVMPNTDIWSLGVTMYVLLLKEYPFNSSKIKEIPDIILNKSITENNSFNILDETTKDLLMKCLHKNPSKRINIDDIINHKWFNDIL